MIRLTLWIVAGLFLGTIIHIVAVIGLPALSPDRIWTRVEALAPNDTVVVLDAVKADRETLPMLDPAMEHALCRFSNSKNAQLISGSMDGVYWSLGLFNRRGEILYSLNDRSIGEGPLKLAISTQRQLLKLQENPPEDIDEYVIVEVPEQEMFVLVRSFRTDPSAGTAVRKMLGELSCLPIER
ncbi:MAG: hypothetical protein ABJN26_01725 [Stappiaceae bacterium]